MPAFRFRFERLLRVKSIREEEWKQEFARASHALREAEARRDAAAQRLMEREAELRRVRAEERLPLERMLLLHTYVGRLRQELEELQREVDAASARVEEVRASLAEAMKERKVLEKLKERHRLAYLEELARIEQRELDEVARNVTAKPREAL